MNEKQIKFIEKLKKKPRQWIKFIELNRHVYNDICRKCQKRVLKTGGNIQEKNLCFLCAEKYDKYKQKIKKLFESEGAWFDN